MTSTKHTVSGSCSYVPKLRVIARVGGGSRVEGIALTGSCLVCNL